MNTNKTFEEKLNSLDTMVANLNKSYAKSGMVDLKQTAAIDELVKDINADITNQRIEELLQLETVELFNTYIDNRFVTLKKFKLDGKTNEYTVLDYDKQLSFVLIEKASKKAICKGIYEKLTALFMDNLVKILQDEQNVNGIAMQKLAMKDEYNSLRKEHDFEKTSMVELEKQLNTILSYLLPEGLTIKAVKADVKYLKNTIGTTKQGKTSIMREDTFINELFTMLYYRKNKLAYEFQSKMTAHK